MGLTDFNSASSAAAATAPVGGQALLHKWDRLGIAASLACAVHCMAAPFLLLLLPAAGSVWSHPAVHWVLAALVLPLALIVVFRGYRHHRRRFALVAAVLGAAFIVAGLVIPAMASVAPSGAEVSAAGLGHTDAGVAADTCTDTCCPSITQDASTGAISFNFPPASIVTMIGSAFLIIAHGINLHGCFCFSRTHDPSLGTCGCPTVADQC